MSIPPYRRKKIKSKLVTANLIYLKTKMKTVYIGSYEKKQFT